MSEEKFDPKKMQEIVDQLQREGNMPSPEEFVRAMGRIRAKYRPQMLAAMKAAEPPQVEFPTIQAALQYVHQEQQTGQEFDPAGHVVCIKHPDETETWYKIRDQGGVLTAIRLTGEHPRRHGAGSVTG